MRVDIGVETCEALGLNPDYVNRLTIDLRPGEITRITAVMLVDLDGSRDFVRHLANYRLTWAPPDPAKRAA